jgi:hypothetical protein
MHLSRRVPELMMQLLENVDGFLELCRRGFLQFILELQAA